MGKQAAPSFLVERALRQCRAVRLSNVDSVKNCMNLQRNARLDVRC